MTICCVKDLGHFWLGYIRILEQLQMSTHLVNFDYVIPDMLQMLFGYRHHANRRCPTSFWELICLRSLIFDHAGIVRR